MRPRRGATSCASIRPIRWSVRRKVLPYKNPDDYERVIEGLRKAGLPP